MRKTILMEPEKMETDEEYEEEGRRVMNQLLVGRNIRNTGRPSVGEQRAQTIKFMLLIRNFQKRKGS